jgi:hypothetical protein
MPNDFEDEDQVGKDIKFLLILFIIVMAIVVALWSK